MCGTGRLQKEGGAVLIVGAFSYTGVRAYIDVCNVPMCMWAGGVAVVSLPGGEWPE